MLVSVLLAVSSRTQPHFLGSGTFSHENISSYVIECDQHNFSNCTSLSQISTSMEAGQSYNINVETEQLGLETMVTFSDVNSLTVSGNSDPNTTTIIICYGETFAAGLTFINITRLTLRKLKVRHCGALYSVKKSTISSALIIAQSRYVSVEDLMVTNSVGVGLMIIDQQSGYLEITSSEFLANTLPRNETQYMYFLSFERSELERKYSLIGCVVACIYSCV